ncbi:hypothetical protein FGG08_005057 [Glutinoglossum americanum]|uniref:EKC/KEOPS complex subunit BUD32 n=1 Tax=Glutinoglossum americanum TaxID=1670608 RepID=A0A9P8I420_9PEZI|nr:hypothetical protein FGG08_005057 [Glutinoglossum americanum]
MADLSDSDLSDSDIIASKPIKEELDKFRLLFKSMCADVKSLILDFILALQNLPAARILRSRSGYGSLLQDLFGLVSKIDSNDFKVKSVVPLLEKVIEVNGCVYNNTEGFYKKYFEGKSWLLAAEQIVRDANPQIIDGCWTAYPNSSSQSAFLEWFWRFQLTFLSGGHSAYYTSYRQSLSGSDCGRQPDLFAVPSGTIKCNGRYNWVDVRVIRELKESILKNYPDEFAKFCEHAREVFTIQPTRLFLHDFVIRGSMVELWIFDRSGPYSGEKFDLHKDPDKFIRVMTGYTMMNDEKLGLNSYIKEDETGKYIMFKGEGRTEGEKLYLEDKPIAFQRAIISQTRLPEQDYGAEDTNKYNIVEANTTSLMYPRKADDGSFDNRIFSCLVVSPPGQAIHEFESILKFLEACRDVIKGHRSLYQDGKILHHDISKNNIIITNTEKEEDLSGMLIDLDLVKELDSGPSGARHRTGTMEFMAIEVLEGKAHTYRHDLESFFHVFL